MTMCQRPGCGQPAAGRLGYLVAAKVVVIDRFVDAPGGVAVLCERHLNRLTPPRGWELEDQRMAQGRLFRLDPPDVGAAADSRAEEARREGHDAPDVATVTPLRRRRHDRRPPYGGDATQLRLDAVPEDVIARTHLDGRDSGQPTNVVARTHGAAGARTEFETGSRAVG